MSEETTVEMTESNPVETEVNTEVNAEQGSEEVEQQEEATTSPETDESEAEDKPKKKGGFQKRIDELTRQRYEEQQARLEAEQRAEELEKAYKEAQLSQQSNQHNLTKPTLEQFDYDHEAWSQALEQWVQDGIKQEQEATREAEQRAKAQQDAINKQVAIQKKFAEATEKYPDFMIKVNDPNLPSLSQINQAAYEAVIDSDMMGELSYYLASNPSEVYEFSSMSPIQAVKAIAKLENKLTANAKPVTNAPEPAPSVRGKGEAVKDPSQMSVDEWMAWRNENLR